MTDNKKTLNECGNKKIKVTTKKNVLSISKYTRENGI